MEVAMGNYLEMALKQQIKALLALNWSYRRIQKETGVHRQTMAGYAKEGDSKPAKVPAGSELIKATQLFKSEDR